MHKTTIILISLNNFNKFRKCLNTILKKTLDDYNIIVIDTNFSNLKKELLKNYKNIEYLVTKSEKDIIKVINYYFNKINNEDIVILNDEVLVSDNWLKKLQICLYDSNKIGAVSPNFDYEFNAYVSNKRLWEEKNYLTLNIILIKNEVIKKIKKIDLRYNSLNILGYDLSLTILNLGYKLYLLNDTNVIFEDKDIHQFNLNDIKLFNKKWHININDIHKKKDYSLPLIENNMNILEINSELGNNLLYLKYYYNAKVTGYEKNKYKRMISKNFFKTYKSFNDIFEKFDCILIGNYLEYVKNPQKFILNISKLLNDNGYIIGEINNPLYIKNIKNIIEDENYFDYMKPNNYSIKDIKNLFKNFKEIKIIGFEKDNQYLEEFIKTHKINSKEIKTLYYTFKYQKK